MTCWSIAGGSAAELALADITTDTERLGLYDADPEDVRGALRGGVRVGLGDVERFRDTVEMFRELDDRFGGGHARDALIRYLQGDAVQLLRGRYPDTVGSALLSAVAEATLLAAWMTYDSTPLSPQAQRYFIQALGLAQQARALARLGDAKACELALAAAVTEYERRQPEADPPWFQYFDEAELSAEFEHCLRDLSRAKDAAAHAGRSVGASADGRFARSDFFATMVLADSYRLCA